MAEHKFAQAFGRHVCFGDKISAEIDGFTVTARVEQDDVQDPPWVRADGHGPVSDWTRRDKLPGERILDEDHGTKRYYDFAEAVKIAERDGWDAPPYGTGTKGERAARAAERDFRMLKAWCKDEWTYCGIVLSVAMDGVTLDDAAAALWGIEMNYPNGADNQYLTEVANELLGDALSLGKAIIAKLCAKNWS